MKLHTTAAVALLASTLALGGCGDGVEQAAPTAAANAPAIDYSNYLDAADREGLRRATAPTVGYGNYVPGSERSQAQESPASDRHESDHGTQDRVRTVE